MMSSAIYEKIRRRWCRGLLAAAIAAAAAGCGIFIPAGEPPAGNIVDNGEFARVRDLDDLESRLVIRLTVSAMTYRESFANGLFIESDGRMKEIMERIAADAAGSAGFKVITGERRERSSWVLQGKVADGNIYVRLCPPGTPDQPPVWSDTAPAAILPPL